MRAMTLVDPLALPQVPAPTKISVPCPPRLAVAKRSRRVLAQASSWWQTGPSARHLMRSRHGLPGLCVQRSQQGEIRLLARIGLSLRGVVEQAIELVHVEVAVEFTIQLYDRRNGARPEASHRDHGELVVRRVTARLEVELA